MNVTSPLNISILTKPFSIITKSILPPFLHFSTIYFSDSLCISHHVIPNSSAEKVCWLRKISPLIISHQRWKSGGRLPFCHSLLISFSVVFCNVQTRPISFCVRRPALAAGERRTKGGPRQPKHFLIK